MKRFLCAALTMVLVLAVCASAGAEAYTHPVAGFQLTIPEGWLAVDSANVDEILSSGQVSDAMAATMESIRPILDGTQCVYLFKQDVTSPPFVNIGVDFKGELETEISADDLLVTAQAYEAYYLETPEQFPGYTVSTPAGVESVEGWYPMGYLGGVYETSGYRIALAQIFVAAGARFYEFTLTAQEDKLLDANTDFGELVGSFIAP